MARQTRTRRKTKRGGMSSGELVLGSIVTGLIAGIGAVAYNIKNKTYKKLIHNLSNSN